MIISVSLLYMAGNTIDSIESFIELFGVDISDSLAACVVIGNVLLFGSHGFSIFIYYKFDKEYNKLFQKYVFCREKSRSGVEVKVWDAYSVPHF